MVTEVVIDTSIITALVTLENYSSWARQKMSEHSYFHILDLTYYEVANALRYKLSPQFSSKQVEEAFTQAKEIMSLFGVHSFGEVVDALSIALEFKIAVYDAAFLCLADTLDIRFLTLDVKLARKLENTKYHRLIECPNMV
jgi:predicted nucleic acid-binding protein